MPQIRRQDSSAKQRLKRRTKDYQEREPYRQAIGSLSGDNTVEIVPEEGESLRKIKLNLARAAKETGASIAYGETRNNTVLAWLADNEMPHRRRTQNMEETTSQTTVRSMSGARELRSRRVQRTDEEDSRSTVSNVERELDQVRSRLTSELRTRRPDLFDASGSPREGALEQTVQEQTGKKKLSRVDILNLLRQKSS